jgi:hypothetical protein
MDHVSAILTGSLTLLLFFGCNAGSVTPVVVPRQQADDDAITALVESYFIAPLEKRLPFIAPVQGLADDMQTYYQGRPPIGVIASVSVREVRHLDRGNCRVYATLVRDGKPKSQVCYVRQVNSKWLLDWHASYGFNRIPLRTVSATARRVVTPVRVWAHLDSYYNYQYRDASETHYSVVLQDVKGDAIHGYVRKDSVDRKRG